MTQSTSVVHINALSLCDKAQMYDLYCAYYTNSHSSVFLNDLAQKNYAILLRDDAGAIRGFSTLALDTEVYDNTVLKVLYSGDTIVDKTYWGPPLLPRAWLQFAGQLSVESPGVPLYWLLIVKGHRTYRYLQLFSKQYYPRYNVETPASVQNVMQALAVRRFGQAYNPSTGLVFFPEPRSALIPELAVIPEKDRGRPEVQFFLSRNPHYTQGVEMVCLCELSQKNLTRLSLKWFLEGVEQRKRKN